MKECLVTCIIRSLYWFISEYAIQSITPTEVGSSHNSIVTVTLILKEINAAITIVDVHAIEGNIHIYTGSK